MEHSASPSSSNCVHTVGMEYGFSRECCYKVDVVAPRDDLDLVMS